MSTVTNMADFSMRKKPLTEESWQEYLQVAQRNSVESIIEFGRRIYEYFLECQHDKVSGGSSFTENAKLWLGLSQSALAQWKVIGERADELIIHYNKLPNAYQTIYHIASLPDDVRQKAFNNGTIHPDWTNREVTQLKRELKGLQPKQTTKPEGSVMWRHLVGASNVAPNWTDRDLRSGQNNGGVRDLVEEVYGKAIPSYVVPDSDEAQELLSAVRTVYAREYPASPATKPVATPIADVSIDQLITQLTKLIPDVVLTEIQPQNGLPSFVYAGLSQARGRIKGMLDAMDKKDQKESLKVLLAVLEYQNKVFEEIVKATKPKYIKALEAKLQKELDEQKDKTAKITEDSVKLPSNMMSQKEVKIIKGVLHPDRLATLTPEKMNAAFLIFQRIYG